jgi:hypothetical protein
MRHEKVPEMSLFDMPWTRRALLVVCPVHFCLGGLGLLMIYPMGISYLFTGLVALLVELAGFAIARMFRSVEDRAHRLLSLMLWIACALTPPMARIDERGEGEGVYVLLIAVIIASCWRLSPRDTRPIGAAAVVVLLIFNITYIWGQTFGRPQALDYIYIALYGATVLPLGVFAIERTVHTFWERRKAKTSRNEER